MLKKLSEAAKRTHTLADYIEEHTGDHFDMSSTTYCAYAFAKRCFNVEHCVISMDDSIYVLASMLQISEPEARALYYSTVLNRKEAVEYLHALSERV